MRWLIFFLFIGCAAAPQTDYSVLRSERLYIYVYTPGGHQIATYIPAKVTVITTACHWIIMMNGAQVYIIEVHDQERNITSTDKEIRLKYDPFRKSLKIYERQDDHVYKKVYWIDQLH